MIAVDAHKRAMQGCVGLTDLQDSSPLNGQNVHPSSQQMCHQQQPQHAGSDKHLADVQQEVVIETASHHRVSSAAVFNHHHHHHHSQERVTTQIKNKNI